MTTDLYNQNGEVVTYDWDTEQSQSIETYDRGWGAQWEDKEALNGQTVTFVGMREAADFGLGPTVAVRFRFDEESMNPDDEPWGVLFTTTSPIVQQLIGVWKRRGPVQIRAKMLKMPSKSNKGFNYWQLGKPDPVQATPEEEPDTVATGTGEVVASRGRGK